MRAAVKTTCGRKTECGKGLSLNPSLAEMRELAVCTEKERCTLLVDLAINDRSVEDVVDSGVQVSVLSKNFYDSLDNKPEMLEATIRLKGA